MVSQLANRYSLIMNNRRVCPAVDDRLILQITNHSSLISIQMIHGLYIMHANRTIKHHSNFAIFRNISFWYYSHLIFITSPIGLGAPTWNAP